MKDSTRSGSIRSNKSQSSSTAPKARQSPSKKSARAAGGLVPSQQDPGYLLEEHTSASEVRPVRFALFKTDAREVFVAGTFNNWQPRTIPLKRQPDDTWATELLLNPGTYEYRFIVDGQWMDDPMATRYVANPFGETNCVLQVKAIG